VDDSGGTFRIERQIVAMMVQYPSIIPEVARRGVAERFLHDDLKRAAGFLLENAAVFAEEPGEAVERFEDEKLRRLLTSMAVGEELWNDKTCHIVLDQFESGWRRRRNDLQKQIESAEKNDDQELLLKLLKEQQARAEMKSVPF
jgi:DNA primase